VSERDNDGAKGNGPLNDLMAELPTDRLMQELEEFLGAVVERGVHAVGEKIGSVTDQLTDYAKNGGSSGATTLASGAKALGEGKSPVGALMSTGLASVKEKVSQMFRGGGGGGSRNKIKVTNIVEQIDVGVPRRVAYNQWTQFKDFPSFMKKVELMEQEEDEKLTVKAQVFWSHRTWRSTIIDQVPDQLIVWRSEGDKGHVDGAVTFHELTPDLTRILVVLEYHPQGLFERTGNIWRAQGRRARLELKHFQRHVMTQTILNPDEVEGWRGEIRDGEVVREHGEEDDQEPADSYEDEAPEDEAPEDEVPEDEVPEDEAPEDEVPEDEVPEDEVPEDEVPEDEAPEDEVPEDEVPEDEAPEDEVPEDEYPDEPEDEAEDEAAEPADEYAESR
jgi:uncharacterized membrane protein